jgi:hypothetical protein
MYGKVETGSGFGLFQVNPNVCFEGGRKIWKIVWIVNVNA